jgi:hypothetical protein
MLLIKPFVNTVFISEFLVAVSHASIFLILPQVVECLPSKCKVPSSNSSTTAKTNKNKQTKKNYRARPCLKRPLPPKTNKQLQNPEH